MRMRERVGKAGHRPTLRAAALSALLSAALAASVAHPVVAEPAIVKVDPAAVKAAQPRLMARETGRIRPGVKGEVELFAVVAAYYPNQGVFLRESEQVSDILRDRFGAEGRVVTLANSGISPMRFPLADRENLAAALAALRAKMNLGEDVLMLYITTHGGREILSAGEWPVDIPDLTAAQLSRLLDRANVPNLVAVIGACHAGSFIPSLRAPDRLVIAAAAADRASFGCSDKNDWTYFGQAFFDRALRQTRDIPRAFAEAAKIVRKWETAEHFTPSNPQMALGKKIAPALGRLARDPG